MGWLQSLPYCDRCPGGGSLLGNDRGDSTHADTASSFPVSP